MSHPPPPPVDYFAPRRADLWRPWWLRLFLALRLRRAKAIDERRHARYLEEMRYAVDE
jgi:hypothetical protein